MRGWYLSILITCILLAVVPKGSGQLVMPDTAYVGQRKEYMVDPAPGSTYTWWINGNVQDGVTSYEFEYTWVAADTYLLQVQEFSAFGCPGPVRSGLVFVRLVPEYEATDLILTKAISPNNDGVNDTWIIGNTSLYPAMEVSIYNRWGQLLWKSARGYPVPWDGRSNDADLPIDSYHYIIDLHNGSKPVIGNVTIVR